MGSKKNKIKPKSKLAKRKRNAINFRLGKLRKAGLLDDKHLEQGAEEDADYPVGSDDWLSCQVDVNKLVQPNNVIDEKILSTKSILPTEANEVPEVKNNLPKQTNIIIDEEFMAEEKYIDEKLIDIAVKKDVLPIDADEWVLQQSLCRCCHAEGAFGSLQDTAPSENITYNDMLSTCFNIQLFPVSGALSGALGALCALCAARLRDAYSFTHQVRACEARLLQLCRKNCIKVAAPKEIEIKEELNADEDDDADFEIFFDEETSDQHPDEKEATVAKKEAAKQKNIKKTPTDKSKKPAKTKKALRSAPRKTPIPRNRLHPDTYTRVGASYKCTRCDKTFKDKQGFSTHFKRVHQKIYPQSKCKHCVDTFANRRLLLIHKLEEHNIDDRIKCNACDKSFYVKQHLRRHMNSYHIMGERIKCSKCDYETYNKGSLIKHQVKHKTTRDFHCKYCKKSFLRKSTLSCHERIHTGDKRKACAECGQAFVQKASLNYHMAKYHPGVKF